MVPESDENSPPPVAPRGCERWEVRVEEGSPHGGLYELEQETFFHVIDRQDGRAVKTFTGVCSASFTGDGCWGEGRGSGVGRVVIDEQGTCAFALHDDRMVERFALTGGPVPDDPGLPWRLAGLPLPSLPMAVDGFTVDEGTDIDQVVAKSASGWVPERAAAQYREYPASWLCDLYLRLNGLPLSSALAASVARGLDGGDEATRGLALCFFFRNPYATSRERVLEVVRAGEPAEAVRPSPVQYGQSGQFLHAPIDVFAAILDTRQLDGFGSVVLQACADALLAPTAYFHERHLEAIARHAPGWLARNATDVVRACPRRLRGLLDKFEDSADLVMSTVTALARDSGTDRRALESWVVDSASNLALSSGMDRGELKVWLSGLLSAENMEEARQRLPLLKHGAHKA